MPPASVTRTLNPLPFGDLEPKRFEDLVRQLAYDFRSWRMLEATGRSGGDDGFDARGYEATGQVVDDTANDGEGQEDPNSFSDRIWLIQCKRERTIGPKKAAVYLREIDDAEFVTLYGIIFVAACDFSKTTRDQIREIARNKGVQEVHIWGKSEIEDQLFQPKNDHLLFAYFGISLRIRQRSMRTLLRAKLAMKRKVLKTIDHANEILLRDPSDDRYPLISDDDKSPPRWVVLKFLRLIPEGIVVEISSQYAFIDDDHVGWDVVEGTRRQSFLDDHWAGDDSRQSELDVRLQVYWQKLDRKNQGELFDYYVIKYEDILDIDEDGDEAAEFPHIYVENIDRLHKGKRLRLIYGDGDYLIDPNLETRRKLFPDTIPAIVKPDPIEVCD